MSKLKKYFFLWSLLVFIGCEIDRECFICPEPLSCDKHAVRPALYLIADFESNGTPGSRGGTVNPWEDSVSGLWVSADIQCSPNHIYGSCFAVVEISGNNGLPQTWTGGGMSIVLSDCPTGIDLHQYDTLLLEVKTQAGSEFDEMKLKLEDSSMQPTPERFLSQFGHFPSDQWTTIRVPMDWFGIKLATDTSLHNWVPLDTRQVRGITFTMIKEHVGAPADGIMCVDEVRFAQQ